MCQPHMESAGQKYSSTNLLKMRIRARSTGSSGRSGMAGNTSSRYSLITVDSVMIAPSCTSTGTCPFGLIADELGPMLLEAQQIDVVADELDALFLETVQALHRIRRGFGVIELEHPSRSF